MITQKKVFLTKEGFEKLKKELDDLASNGRRAVAQRIKQAKEYGDLSENSEYADAKDQQAFIEGRIAELENILKNATLIEETKNSGGIVSVGSTVHVELEGGKEIFRIVGSAEADPEKGFISNESPIGQALLGKKKGEEVEVSVPAGIVKYKVVHIE